MSCPPSLTNRLFADPIVLHHLLHWQPLPARAVPPYFPLSPPTPQPCPAAASQLLRVPQPWSFRLQPWLFLRRAGPFPANALDSAPARAAAPGSASDVRLRSPLPALCIPRT